MGCQRRETERIVASTPDTMLTGEGRSHRSPWLPSRLGGECFFARAGSASRARDESAKFRVRCAFGTRTEASGPVSRCGDRPTRGVDGYLQRGAIDGSLTEQQRPGDSRDGVELLRHRRRRAGPRALRVRISQTEKQKTRFDPVGRHRTSGAAPRRLSRSERPLYFRPEARRLFAQLPPQMAAGTAGSTNSQRSRSAHRQLGAWVGASGLHPFLFYSNYTEPGKCRRAP